MRQGCWWLVDFSQEGEERLSTLKMKTPTRRSTNLRNLCMSSQHVRYIQVLAFETRSSVCSCTIIVPFCLFQHQPHHRSRRGTNAEPHWRDDGGAEGVRSWETRQYVWQVVKVNITNTNEMHFTKKCIRNLLTSLCYNTRCLFVNTEGCSGEVAIHMNIYMYHFNSGDTQL